MTTSLHAPLRQPLSLSPLEIGLGWFPDGIGGGSHRFFSTLAQYLNADGVQLHGVVPGRDSVGHSLYGNIQVVCRDDAPLVDRLRSIRTAVRDILARHRIDLIASHFALFQLACLDVIKDRPIVTHFHGPWAQEARIEGESLVSASGKFLLEKIAYARAQRIIVLSRAFRDLLHRNYGVPLEKIRIVPGGVDLERFNTSTSKTSARARLGLPMNRPIIVTVRRLAKRMGLENLITSFTRVHKTHRDSMLFVVGGGELFDTLRDQADVYGLADHVVFRGRVPEADLPLYYRAADLSVVPSIALEGFGLVVAESLACGTPALVTPIGGLPEVVAGLSEGLIFQGSDATSIADGLGAALSARLPLPSSQACSVYARMHFSWPSIADRVKSVYHEVL